MMVEQENENEILRAQLQLALKKGEDVASVKKELLGVIQDLHEDLESKENTITE